MPSISHPLWLLAPLLALALLFVGAARAGLPGGWSRAIHGDLQRFLATGVHQRRSTMRRLALLTLWLLLTTALATISFGSIERPQRRHLEARVVVIDLGVPALAEDRIAAARFLIDSAPDVPTAVVAVTEQAFDVVPLTRDAAHLDRYLEVLTADVMPIKGRSLHEGIERAITLLDRADIQARQIAVFTGDRPPSPGRYGEHASDADHNIWLVLPDDTETAWEDVAASFSAKLARDGEMEALHRDVDERRQRAVARSVSVRERQDVTPWLIVLLLPLWLLLFFRRWA